MVNLVHLGVWIGLLAGLLSMSSFLEKRAAMRGTNRKPLSPWIDKGIRLFFLSIFLFPVYVIVPFPNAFLGLSLLYVPFYLDGTEKKGNRVSWIVRNFPVWYLLRAYFNTKIDTSISGKLDATKQYIIGIHPHGFLPLATVSAMLTDTCSIGTEYYNGVSVRALAASFCFYIPVYRDILLGGGVIDAARYNAKQALDHGVSISLVPGGATEGLYARPGTHKLVLKKRKGFIKLALEHGCDLVPMYSFGETDCYNQLGDVWPAIKRFQTKFQRVLGLSLPLVTNLIPNRAKITLVFGKPISVAKVEKPTAEEVDALLDVYMKELTALFNQKAPEYIENPDHRKLEII